MWLNAEISRVFAFSRWVWVTALVAGCPQRAPQTDEGEEAEQGEGDEQGTTTAPTTGGESESGEPHRAPEVCRRWVACSAVIDPDADMASELGEEGSCWDGSADEQAECIKLCDGQLHVYAEAFPEEPECSVEGLPVTVQFTLGEAVFDPENPLEPFYKELPDGGTMKIVRGGQGLLMLPFAVRGSGFVVPPNPNAWDDPKMPHIDMWIDIEGHNVGFGGHFARLNEYPIGFVPIDDEGTLEHLYIAIIVPDAIEDPQTLTNKKGVVHAELRTYMQSTVVRELEFVVAPEIQEM